MIEGVVGFDLNNKFHRTLADGKTLKISGGEARKIFPDYDPAREYRINSLGYRGPEFIPDAPILAAGCSFTFGRGADESAIWPSVISRSMGLEHNNLSKSGASVSWIVEKIFSYFREFGHPKYLFCLFPDTKRFVAPVDGVVLTRDPEINPKNFGEPGTSGKKGQYLYNEMGKNLSELVETKYLKRPYNIRDLHTPELGLYLAVRQIRILEQYCKLANINFIWGTWDYELSYYAAEINKHEDLKFDSYGNLNVLFYKKMEQNLYKDAIFNVDMGNESEAWQYINCINNHDNVECDCYQSKCHSDLKDLYGERDFHTGSDILDGDLIAHPGAHLHSHYAEAFLAALARKV